MDCADRHLMEYGTAPDVVVRVPEVITFIGEFAEESNGCALCGTGPAGLYASVSLRNDDSVHLSNASSGDHKHFTLSNIKYRKEDKWANYVKGVVVSLCKKGCALKGFDIAFSGDMLGYDSSSVASAMAVSVCVSLDRLQNLGLGKGDIVAVSTNAIEGFCLEKASQRILKTMVNAEEGKLVWFDMETGILSTVPCISSEAGYSFFLVDAMISPHAMREEIDDRHVIVRQSLVSLRKHYRGSVRKLPVRDIRQRVFPLDGESVKSCCFIYDEYQAALQVFNGISSGDLSVAGKAMNQFDKQMRDVMELSCPEIDWLLKRMSETQGCIGACLCCRGIGGTVAMVASAEASSNYLANIADYERIFGFKASVTRYLPGPGVVVLT